MKRWSDSIRANDPAFFCRKSIEALNDQSKNEVNTSADSLSLIVWIVTDARRKTDLEFFKSNYGERVKTIRIVADESVRTQRGWKFTQGNLDFDFNN